MNNLEFACHIEPYNTDAQQKYEWAKKQREKKLKTVRFEEFKHIFRKLEYITLCVINTSSDIT